MNTLKIATLGLALGLGIVGAKAAQPLTQPTAGETVAPMMQPAPVAGKTRIGTVKTGAVATPAKPVAGKTTALGPKAGEAGLSAGRSVATSKKGTLHRQHVSSLRSRHAHHAHIAHVVHVAHVAKKVPTKHA